MSDSNPIPDDYNAENTVYATEPEAEGSVTFGSQDEYERPYRDPNWLYHQYHVMKKSQIDICEMLGVSKETVQRWMDKHGIERRSRSESQRLRYHGSQRPWESEEWLRKQYQELGKSADQIADEQGTSKMTILRSLKRKNIPTRERHTRSKSLDSPLKDHEWLREQYVEKRLSTGDIAEGVDYEPQSVRRELDRAGIERRSQQEAALNRYERENSIPKSRVPERGEDEDETETGESTTAVTGKSSYDGPATGIDMSWSDFSEKDLVKWVPYRDKDWLHWQYRSRNNTLSDIAEICGVSKQTISQWVKRHGIVSEDEQSTNQDGSGSGRGQ